MATKTFTPVSSTVFVVPDQCTSIVADIKGGGGGVGGGSVRAGAAGGRIQATLTVSPGDSIRVTVAGGGRGGSQSSSGAGGYSGGGNGGAGDSGYDGGGGGGCTTVVNQTTGQTMLVAAGGGGSGSASTAGNGGGGVGGGSGSGTGAASGAPGGNGTNSATGGGAGTGSTGGSGGQNTSGSVSATAGSSLKGGNGSTAAGTNSTGGGGGGAGYFGGGGGGGSTQSVGQATGSAGGGSGSDYVGTTNVSNITRTAGGGGAGGASAPSNSNISAGGNGGNGAAVFTYNTAPYAPTLVAPVNNSNVDASLPTAFQATFSDDDTGSSVGTGDFRYRYGTGAWTTVNGFSPIATSTAGTYEYDTTAGTFNSYVGGQIEWQVRFRDNVGAVSPWSASGYFNPLNPPTTPTISQPDGTTTIATKSPTVTFSGDSPVVAYQIVVQGGSDTANPGATVYDTGTVSISGGTTSPVSVTVGPVQFANNQHYVFVVRYQTSPGVWSATKSSASTLVNVNAPNAPTATLSASNASASIRVDIQNPTPDAYPPLYNDVYRTNLDEMTPEIRVAKNVPVNGSYTDFTAGSRCQYRYRINAVNATTSTSSQ